MAPTLQVKINGGVAQTGKVTAAVGDTVQMTADVGEMASWRSPVARWRIMDFPPTMTEPSGWSTASEGAITYYYFDGNTQPPSWDIVEFGPHMLDLTTTAADGSRETTRATYVKVPSSSGVELIGYGEPVYTWVKTSQADGRAILGTPTFESLTLEDSGTGETLAISFDGVDAWEVDSSVAIALRASTGGVTLDVSGSSAVTIEEAGTPVITILPDADGATSCTYAAGCTSITDGHAQRATSGVGATRSLRAQQGNGNVGGSLTIGGGLGGTPGTHKAGATIVDLGAAVGGASAEFRVVADSARIITIEQLAASTHQLSFGTTGGTDGGTVRGGPYLNLESATGPVQLIPSTSVGLFGTHVEVAGQVSSDTNDIAFSATPTLDCNLSNHHRIAAMTGNITTLDMSNIRDGATYTVEVTQDGAGAHTIAWAAKFVFGDTYTNAPKAAASSKTIWRFLSDGTNVRCIGKETF